MQVLVLMMRWDRGYSILAIPAIILGFAAIASILKDLGW